jgi:hypothetical protein
MTLEPAATKLAAQLAANADLSPLDALVAIASAMAEAAAASVKAMESLQEFVDAHKTATQAGHGVVVVRNPDGTITSTPNVLLGAGTAVFMDAPGPMAPPAFDWEAAIPTTTGPKTQPDVISHLRHVPEYLPRYTIAEGRPIVVTGAA